jgi:hypothetical protein
MIGVMDRVERVTTSRGGRRRRRVGHLAGLAVFLLLAVLWLLTAANQVSLLDRDWVAFDNAGWRGLGGDWTGVYVASAGDRWPYLYPPTAIPLALPLGLLPYYASYVLAVVMGIGGVFAAWRRMVAASEGPRDRELVLLSALLCAPTTLQVLVTGQYSWLYLWALAVMAAAWGRSTRVGWALAALSLKPPLAVMFLPLLVAQRRWQALWRAATVTAAASAVTLLWGAGPWLGFVQAVRDVAERQGRGDAPIEKQVTLLGFAQVLSGGRASPTVGIAVALVAAVTFGWAFRVWRRLDGAPPLRLVGSAVLLAVALTPRLYFYDALVLALPAAAWYLGAGRYGTRAARRVAGTCLAGVVLATLLFFTMPVVGTVVGPLSLLWAVVELRDLSGARARSRTPAAAADEDLVLAG